MKKVLIIQTAFIGDAILASALVEKFAAAKGHFQIDFLLRKGNESLFDSNPHIEKILIWDKKNKYSDLFRLLKEIRNERYDLVVNLQRFLSTGFLTAFSKGKNKVGFKKNPLSLFFTKSFTHPFGDGSHEVDRNLALIEEYTDSKTNRPKLHPTQENFEKVQPFKEESYITISPSSVWFTKQYPKEKWIEFLNGLATRENTPIVYVLGGPGDVSLGDELIEKSTNNKIKNLAGKLRFLESSALMKDARMNYVNDSAPLHLCSAVNAPVTAIFCSTIPAFGFTPLSDTSIILETKETLDCRPCGLHGKKACPKGHFKCGEINSEVLLDRFK